MNTKFSEIFFKNCTSYFILTQIDHNFLYRGTTRRIRSDPKHGGVPMMLSNSSDLPEGVGPSRFRLVDSEALAAANIAKVWQSFVRAMPQSSEALMELQLMGPVQRTQSYKIPEGANLDGSWRIQLE